MVMGIVICAMFLAIVIMILTIIHACSAGSPFRRHELSAGDSNHPIPAGSAPGLKQDDIKALPVFDYVLEGNENSVECTVCLDNFTAGQKCRALPQCNHLFHGHCIDSWLKKTGACPVCRTAAKNDMV